MAAVYDYSRAQQNLASLLEQALKEGEVKIRRKDGQVFVVRPECDKASPLDIEGLNLNITTDELVAVIREGRVKTIL